MTPHRHYFRSLLTSSMRLICVLSALLASAQASELALAKFAYGTVENSQSVSSNDYQVLLSVPKQVNHQLRIAKKLRISTKGVATTLQINSGHSPDEAFNFYTSYYSNLGAKTLFQCESRDCGSSNIWANDIFKVLRLYGKDRSQRYSVSLLPYDNVPYVLVIYTVERDNGRAFAHIELLRVSDVASLGEFKNNLALDTLFFVIDFPEKGGESPMINAVLRKGILEQINKHKEKHVYLVGHRLTDFSSIENAIDQSGNMNTFVKDWLVKQGVDSTRISMFAAGPLVPINKGKRKRNRVELLLLDSNTQTNTAEILPPEINND